MRAARTSKVAAVLIAALTCLGDRASLAQPTHSRRLEVPDSAVPSFADLVAFQAARRLGNRLPHLSHGEPLTSAVLVIARVDGVAVWDKPITKFERGHFPTRTLALCPGLCSPALRDVAAAALADLQSLPPAPMMVPTSPARHRRIRGTPTPEPAWEEDRPPPAALVLADAELPYKTLHVVLRSLAAATDGAPPALRLVVKTPAGLQALPVFMPPPSAARLPPSAYPLFLEVEIESGVFRARTSRFFSRAPLETRSLSQLQAALGHLKSRAPQKRVAFLAAPGTTPIKALLPVVEVVRSLYPVLVLKPRGPIPFPSDW